MNHTDGQDMSKNIQMQENDKTHDKSQLTYQGPTSVYNEKAFQEAVNATAMHTMNNVVDRAVQIVVEQTADIVAQKAAQAAELATQQIWKTNFESAVQQAAREAAEETAKKFTQQASQVQNPVFQPTGVLQPNNNIPFNITNPFHSSNTNNANSYNELTNRRGTQAGRARGNRRYHQTPYEKGLKDTAYFFGQIVTAVKENVAITQQRNRDEPK